MNVERILLGTSGWSYKDWIGSVYPEGGAATKFLRVYAERFPTVEIDSTFYGIPRESTVEKWRVYCGCIYGIASQRWTVKEFQQNFQTDFQQLRDDNSHSGCIQKAGVPNF